MRVLPGDIRARYRVARLRRRIARDLDRSHDALENAATAPPDDERIGVHSVWVAEVFPLGLADRLDRHIARLHHDRDDEVERMRGFLERGRRSPGGMREQALGFILRPDDSRFLGGHFRESLPARVDCAKGWVVSLSASFTAVIVEFLYEPGGVTDLEDALRQPSQTVVRTVGRSMVQYIGPRQRKADKVQALRRRLRMDVATWMGDHLGGLFTDIPHEAALPTCEIVTLRRGDPFERPPDSLNSYLTAIGVGDPVTGWRSAQEPTLGLWLGSRPYRADVRDELSLLGAIREADWSEGDRSSYGADLTWQISNRLGDLMPQFLAWWAFWGMLERLEAETVRLTNLVARGRTRRFFMDVRDLRKAQTRLLSSVDYLVPIAIEFGERDLGELARRTSSDFSALPLPEPQQPTARDRPRRLPRSESLLNDLLRPAGTRLEHLEARNARLAESSSTAASLSVARASLTLAVVVGVIGVGVAAVQLVVALTR